MIEVLSSKIGAYEFVDSGLYGASRHVAAAIVQHGGYSRQAVTVCGRVFADGDDWARGFGSVLSGNECPVCLAKAHGLPR